MVTRYDIFLYLADKNIATRTPEVMKQFNRRKYEYANTYRLLTELVKEGLATKSDQGFQIRFSKKSQLLHSLITYCLSNGINYNLLIDKGIAEFIAKAMLKIEFTSKDFSIDPKTFKKYTGTLFRYGLIVRISSKPFKAMIVWNILFANLLQFFDLPIIVKKEKRMDFLSSIEKELNVFNKKRDKNEPSYKALIDESEIKFVHSSLYLEGNPITLPDTIKILKNKIIPRELKDSDVKEIQNYQTAIKEMIKDSLQGNTLNKEKILNYHFLSMQHKQRIAGKIRKVDVYIKGNPNFKIASLRKIDSLFDELMKDYGDFVLKKHNLKEIIEFAAYFHNQFQFIHPFEDGNSRTTRLITFHILQYFKIPILDIPVGMLDQYLKYTKGYKKRDDEKLNEALQLIILYNLKAINERL